MLGSCCDRGADATSPKDDTNAYYCRGCSVYKVDLEDLVQLVLTSSEIISGVFKHCFLAREPGAEQPITETFVEWMHQWPRTCRNSFTLRPIDRFKSILRNSLFLSLADTMATHEDLTLSHDAPGSSGISPLLRDSPLLTPLEQEILDEYAKLLDNMNKVGLFSLNPSLAYNSH